MVTERGKKKIALLPSMASCAGVWEGVWAQDEAIGEIDLEMELCGVGTAVRH